MKITIKRSDWKRSVEYNDPYGCLLARAVKRQLKTRSDVVVFMEGWVEIANRAHYYNTKIEPQLIRAHKTPSLLPISITLKPA